MDATPTLNDKISASQAHTYQATHESQTAQRHHAEIFAFPAKIAMTAEEQNAAIRQAFANDDTMPKERELRDAIGKTRPAWYTPVSKPSYTVPQLLLMLTQRMDAQPTVELTGLKSKLKRPSDEGRIHLQNFPRQKKHFLLKQMIR